MSVCADAWRQRGVPTLRLSNIQSTVRVVKEMDRLEGIGLGQLKHEYCKLGLPSASAVPEDEVELLSRLKSVALWREFPGRGSWGVRVVRCVERLTSFCVVPHSTM